MEMPVALAPPKNLLTYTFGCKVNQADTAYLENSLERAFGATINDATRAPDTILINTCTVTASADRQARRLIRRLRRVHPGADLVVTGCYAQAKPAEVAALEGVRLVLPLAGQAEVVRRFGGVPAETAATFYPGHRKTRLNLKLQDGCNAYCSFCVLPYVRGRSRSLDPSALERAARDAGERYHEIVLTGTHLAGYGRDLPERLRLSDLVARLLAAAPRSHLRISSLEPTGLTPDFIRTVAREPRIRPHFHIPLQSGSAGVLRRMNRKYSPANYRDRVAALWRASRSPSIGADVIVGFPGETRAEFEETARFVADLPLTQLHVFPYSPRPGTRAATLADDVDFHEKKDRVHRLREIGARRHAAFLRSFVGGNQEVLVELKKDARGRLTGHTPHHAEVRFAGPDRLMQRAVEVRAVALEFDAGGEPFLAGEVAA